MTPPSPPRGPPNHFQPFGWDSRPPPAIPTPHGPPDRPPKPLPAIWENLPSSSFPPDPSRSSWRAPDPSHLSRRPPKPSRSTGMDFRPLPTLPTPTGPPRGPLDPSQLFGRASQILPPLLEGLSTTPGSPEGDLQCSGSTFRSEDAQIVNFWYDESDLGTLPVDQKKFAGTQRSLEALPKDQDGLVGPSKGPGGAGGPGEVGRHTCKGLEWSGVSSREPGGIRRPSRRSLVGRGV